MRRRLLRTLALILFIWAVAAALLLVFGYTEAKAGQRHLTAAKASARSDGLRTGAIDADLRNAKNSMGAAHSKLASPVLFPIRPIPIVGHQLTSAIHLSGAGATASSVAYDTLTKVRALEGESKTDRAATLAKIATICSEQSKRLGDVDLGPSSGLMDSLMKARTDASHQLSSLQTGLIRGGAASDGLSNLLGKPGNYLLIAANNGEMRNGSGMFLQAGVLQTGNNKLTLTGMSSAGSITAPAETVTWPPDIEKNWGWLGQKGDFRDLMLSPRYDANAPLAKQIWEQGGRPKVDGVITLDVAMMRSLLAITGPVTVDNVTFNSSNVERLLLFDQYKATGSAQANVERREALSIVAGAAFEKFTAGAWDVTTAAKELSAAAQGRHLLIWSADKQMNERWVTAGVNGGVRANNTMLGVINLGTNKLDQFLNIDASMDTTKDIRAVDTTLTVKLTNTAPKDGLPYVLGGVASDDIPEGSYRGMLAFSLPADLANAHFDNNLPLSVSGTDGASQLVATAVDVPRGNSQTFVLHYARPSSTQGTVVGPSARIPAINWSYRNSRWTDSSDHKITY